MDEDNSIDIGEMDTSQVAITSIKQIALEQIKRIGNIFSQELTEGRWESKPLQLGGTTSLVKKYFPDQKIAYCNAVDFLTDLIYPDSTKDFQKYIDKIYEEEKDVDEIDDVKDVNFKKFWKDRVKKRKLMFREANKMFNVMDYFSQSMDGNE